jgi:hypothetical protein
MLNQQYIETKEVFLNRIPSPFSKDKLITGFRPKFLLLQWHITN